MNAQEAQRSIARQNAPGLNAGGDLGRLPGLIPRAEARLPGIRFEGRRSSARPPVARTPHVGAFDTRWSAPARHHAGDCLGYAASAERCGRL